MRRGIHLAIQAFFLLPGLCLMFLLSFPPIRPRTFPWDLETLIAIPFFWLLWAMITRGGFSLTLAGLGARSVGRPPAQQAGLRCESFPGVGSFDASPCRITISPGDNRERFLARLGAVDWRGGSRSRLCGPGDPLSFSRAPMTAWRERFWCRYDSITFSHRRPRAGEHPLETRSPRLMNNSPGATLRWRAVLRCVWPIAFLLTLAAGLVAIDPWLAQFPREPGRRWTEAFLRSLLMGYLGVSVVVPLLLITSVIGVLRGAGGVGGGRGSPAWAYFAECSGSAFLRLELTARAWLAWEHRMPRLPITFAQPATPDDALSLVVIGGSSALGYPYNPTVSVGQIVAWQIEEAIPGRRVLLDIRANLGKNLEEMHTGLLDLKRKPDALIIYSGHNEFLSRFRRLARRGVFGSARGSVSQPALPAQPSFAILHVGL